MPSDVKSKLETRARGMLPWLKLDAAALMLEWPSRPGTLPCSGRFWAEGTDTESILVIEGMSETLDELFRAGSTERESPWFTWRIDGGGVRFDFSTAGVKIEYHPLGKRPSSFQTTVRIDNELGKLEGRVDHVMERFVKLETQWFLVWYSVRDVDEKSPT